MTARPGLSWEVAVAAGAELGERPFWDAGRASLMWVDISAGHLHEHRPGGGDEIVLDLAGVALGAAAPRRGGGYVLATADGFRLTGAAGGGRGRQPGRGLRPPGMAADTHFNDGACDPAGRFWAGTVTGDVRPGAGALYRLDPDGTVTRSSMASPSPTGWAGARTAARSTTSTRASRSHGSGRSASRRPAGNWGAPVTWPASAGGGPVPDGLVVDAEGTPVGRHLGRRPGAPVRTGR